MKYLALLGRQTVEVWSDGSYMICALKPASSESSLSAELFRISLSQIKIVLGGQNSHQYFLSDMSGQNTVVLQSSAFIEDLARRGNGQATEVLTLSRHKSFIRRAVIALPVFATLALLLLVPFVFKSLPEDWIDKIVTPHTEARLAKPFADLFHAEVSSPKAQQLQVLVDQLVESNLKLASFNIEAYYSDDTQVNAFAIPGSKIIINKGLIQSASSIEEVLGVIAHELGHVEHRHVVRSVVSGLGYSSAFLFLGTIIGFDFASAVLKATNLVNLKYSRENEHQADITGAEYLFNAGISSSGMVAFFSRMAANENATISKAISFLSTHPISEDRIQMIQQLPSVRESTFRPRVSLEELKN